MLDMCALPPTLGAQCGLKSITYANLRRWSGVGVRAPVGGQEFSCCELGDFGQLALLSAPQMSHLENGLVELDDPYSHVCGPLDGRRSKVYAPWGLFLPLLESSLVALMCLQKSLPTRRSQALECWS